MGRRSYEASEGAVRRLVAREGGSEIKQYV